MVAIRNESADAFLKGSLAHISIVLIFGTDAGLVNERSRLAVKAYGVSPSDPFQFVRLDGSAIASDPARLLDEANTVSLFGSARLLFIELGSSDISEPIEELLKVGDPGSRLVITAGALKRDSAIRKICERSKIAASIECQADQMADLEALLDAEMTRLNIRIEDAARGTILRSLGADRLATRAEIFKLATFAGMDGSISLLDVETLLADGSAVALEQAVNFSFAGDMQGVEKVWRRLHDSGADTGMFVPVAAREATALHLLFSELDQGGQRERAEQKYFRTAYGRMPLTSDKLRKWNSAKAMRALEITAAASARVRLEPKLAAEQAARTLWSISFLASA